MKRTKDIYVALIGIIFFLISLRLDEKVRVYFQGARFEPIDAIFGIISNFGVVILVMLIVPCLILYKKNKKLIYLLVTAFVISILLSFLIKLVFLRPRPFDAFTYPFINILNYSFPSMHSMVVFSLLPIIMTRLKRQKYFWLSFALLVAFSRVYFGFHFLSDVVFGAIVGYLIGKFLLDMFERSKLWK